ncbi:MAG: HD domain-containing protein [Rhodothermales bacterium]
MTGAFSPLIDRAIELAAEWHDGTYRKSRWRPPAFQHAGGADPFVPVMTHLTAVALTVQRAGWDESTVAAAFLHDLLEDPNRERAYFSVEQLEAEVGPTVTTYVRAVSERSFAEDGTFRKWIDRKQEYIAVLQTAPVEAVAISLADKLHNLWTMNQALASGIDIFQAAPGRKRLSAGPDRQLWFIDAVLEATADHDDARLDPIRIQLYGERDRFAAITEQAS